MLKLIIFAILLQSAFCQFKSLCPSLEDISPCRCVSDGIAIRVDCTSVTSAEEVRRGLASVKGIKGVYIDFLRARFDKVPSDLFSGLNINKISFTNCELKEFGDKGRSALEGLEDLIEELSIQFSFSEENELKYLNVSQLRALENLEIEGNGLTKMGNDWFRDGPRYVKTLYIMTNFIEELGDEVFSSLVNLKTLWLTGNKFKILKRSMFPTPASFLTSLDLTDNGISSLPGDMFSDMPSLKEIVLADNAIQRLPESTWSSIWRQVTRVYLETNPLECDSHMDWIFKVPRPYVLKGRCVAPEERKNKDLKRIIDDKNREDILDNDL